MSKYAPDGTAYEVTGNGPLVVLIHGLGLSQALWNMAFPGYRVVAYDLYGHGNSVPPPEEASLGLYARQIAGLMDHLEEQSAHIVGFSIGGMINRRFALDYPARVASLVILNSPHDRGPDAQAAVEAQAAKVREAGGMATLPAALKRWFTPDFLEQGAVSVRAWRLAADAEGYAQAMWVLANGVRELTGRDGEITAPTLVMTCENDSGSTPQMSRDIAAEIPGAEVVIVPGLQHLGLMEDPDAFTGPILDFLDKVAS